MPGFPIVQEDLEMETLGHRHLLRRSVAELLSSEPDTARSHGGVRREASSAAGRRPHTAPAIPRSVTRELAAQEHTRLQGRLIKAKGRAVMRIK